MDELDLLKNHWNKSDSNEKQISIEEIYPMLLKKSSSIVKTLFYISIAELILWILINALPLVISDGYSKHLDTVYGDTVLISILHVLIYCVIVVFAYFLYKSYKSISVTDNAKKLMESILKTRKIIKYYVIYNLMMAGIISVFLFYLAFTNNPELMVKLNETSTTQTVIIIVVAFTAFFIVAFWGFYKLLYGILLNRLNKNYIELKKLEI